MNRKKTKQKKKQKKHEDHPNQHENSHKQCDETEHPVVNLMESQWKQTTT